MEDVENLKGFLPNYFIGQILGLLSIVLVFFWIASNGGGFGFTGAGLFNWHPLFMIIGMVFLLGNGILTFRAFRNLHKDTLKILHASINAVALLFAILAFVAVYANHVQGNTANFYTLHSWIGILTVLIFVAQLILGFAAFLYPGFSGPLRSRLMPYHVYFGFVIFAGGIASVISGINEKAIFKLSNTYSTFVFEGILLNITGLIVTFFALFVGYLATYSFYKRLPRPEDSQLLTRTG